MDAPVVNRLRPKLLLQLFPAATGLEASLELRKGSERSCAGVDRRCLGVEGAFWRQLLLSAGAVPLFDPPPYDAAQRSACKESQEHGFLLGLGRLSRAVLEELRTLVGRSQFQARQRLLDLFGL